MSIKHSLLALLSRGPRYGYQLRLEFEESTGGTWPLNIGQVYTTLDRLQDQGFVSDLGIDDNGQRHYEITDLGREELDLWFGTPTKEKTPRRDELLIKLAFAVTTPGVDAEQVIQRQRASSLSLLQEYTRAKRAGRHNAEDHEADLAGMLVLEALIFQVEALIRWLDHCEGTILKAARKSSLRGATRSATQPSQERVHHD